MTAYEVAIADLQAEPRRWLVTGCAGFIGSHLVETLLKADQRVSGLDNLSTGSPRNLDAVRENVSATQWKHFEFREGSVADMGACREASNYCDFVVHQAGFVSVPLSIEDPIGCHQTNVTGTLNLLAAARDNRVRRFVFASSSAVYGDDPAAAKVEAQIGRPLSPYGAAKLMTEIYARQFFDHYGLETIGLRYFNVFGPRQNPTGGYAAVIPQWISKCVRGEECVINGDGGITRDFCHVANVVQANILAATTRNRGAAGESYNVALGGSTTLAQLYDLISARVADLTGQPAKPIRYGAPRPGDIIHSSADIGRIRTALSFDPAISVDAGLEETVAWYARLTS
jgi:UDP-N-acetylglucosamine 4-epimerase